MSKSWSARVSLLLLPILRSQWMLHMCYCTSCIYLIPSPTLPSFQFYLSFPFLLPSLLMYSNMTQALWLVWLCSAQYTWIECPMLCAHIFVKQGLTKHLHNMTCAQCYANVYLSDQLCLRLVTLQRRDATERSHQIRSQVPMAADSNVFPLKVWLYSYWKNRKKGEMSSRGERCEERGERCR